MSLSKRLPKRDKGKRDTSTDWGLCLVRWALLVLVLVMALFDPSHYVAPRNIGLLFLGLATYNLTITILLAAGILTAAIPVATLVLDTVTILVLLHFSGSTLSMFFFLPLFPILVATLRFGWEIGLLVAGIFVAAVATDTALSWIPGDGLLQVYPVLLMMLLFLLTVVVTGVTNRRPTTWPPGSSFGRLGDDDDFVPERAKLAYEMASTLSATLNYERVLEAILDISHLGFDELGYRVGESVGLVLLYDHDGMLFVASHRNLTTQDDEVRRIPGEKGIAAQSIASAEAIIGDSPADDPELSVFQSLQPAKSMLCVPLRAGFETYGAVLFASVRRKAYRSEHVELLSIFCYQATIALQNANLYKSLREERDKIIDKEEQARHKLARDLHDGPTQDVAAIAMRLNFARLLMERDPTRARAELARLEDLAHHTVKEIRSMLFTLRPIILETEGLVAALNQYADNLRENDKLPVQVDAEHYEDCLDTEAQGVVFAILEEAVNNAKKHAEASKIWVQLAVQGDMFVAQVVDNGRGFDLEAVERDYGSRGSLGMINLRERADLVGGNLNIESTMGRGTRVTLIVPLDEELV
jgi:signal transduction histidine kinase